MVNDVPSMSDFFPVCARILAEAMRPLHYAELTERGLKALEWRCTRATLSSAAGDVREKMLGHRRYGSAYVGRPLCVGILRRWFLPGQLQFLNTREGVYIPHDPACQEEASFEAVMRIRHMLPKGANDEQHARRVLAGLSIEKHVAGWFRMNFPNQYREPENVGKYEEWCRHDFRVTIGQSIVGVDVMSPSRDGSYRVSPSKPKTHIHLMAERDLFNVRLYGFRFGRELVECFGPDCIAPISRFIVRLRCEANDWDYGAMVRIAKTRGAV